MKLSDWAKSQGISYKTAWRWVVTARDEWVYDFSQTGLKEKIQFFIKNF